MGLPQYKEDDRKITLARHQEFVKAYLEATKSTSKTAKAKGGDDKNCVLVGKGDPEVVHLPPFQREH
ncbi:hypothetical protein NW752_005487 [Fusarium irregulare]|uniref:Uncharacterized protein n=1 Tax=Fusarium irregulare TaxID=2494466 RepID=A0A9W8PRJ1_9HYPO|nr:hypothetical protein NW766_006015 [Fusarium irregulare]KAJ4018372.1 hypothetical protein NW752_005487 [Fusarium irregulare]